MFYKYYELSLFLSFRHEWQTMCVLNDTFLFQLLKKDKFNPGYIIEVVLLV